MKDKDWLDKIITAYTHYPNQSDDIKNFIAWLYKQYGIVLPKELKDK
jgi:hypothetical protein